MSVLDDLVTVLCSSSVSKTFLYNSTPLGTCDHTSNSTERVQLKLLCLQVSMSVLDDLVTVLCSSSVSRFEAVREALLMRLEELCLGGFRSSDQVRLPTSDHS